MNPLYVASLAIVVLLASASHAGVSVGIPVGTGLLDKRKAVALYVVAAVAGALVQGKLMWRAVIAPTQCTMVVATLLSAVPALLGIPLSLNFVLYTAQIGCVISRTQNTYELALLPSTLLAWLCSTALVMVAAYCLQRAFFSLLSQSKAPSRLLDRSEILLILLSALMSFVVGANTFGYVFLFAGEDQSLHALLYVLFMTGALLMSHRSIEQVAFSFFSIRISQAVSSLLVTITCIQVATLASTPISASLVLVSSIFATGYASMVYVVKARSFAVFVATQLLSVPTALVFGYVLSHFI